MSFDLNLNVEACNVETLSIEIMSIPRSVKLNKYYIECPKHSLCLAIDRTHYSASLDIKIFSCFLDLLTNAQRNYSGDQPFWFISAMVFPAPSIRALQIYYKGIRGVSVLL